MCRCSRIRELNDKLRTTLSVVHGKVVITSGVNALSATTKLRLSAAIMAFKDFDAENDPFDEHDFGSVEVDGETFFFKIDYYDSKLEFGSEDPADPSKTIRVCTIMRSLEY